MSRSTRRDYSEPIRDKKWKLPFGKYSGRTLEEVMGEDPHYLTWIQENTDVDIHSDVFDELEEQYRTAKGLLHEPMFRA